MSTLWIRILALASIAQLCILCPTPHVRSARAALPPGSPHVLVWSDEFNGTALDETKWGHRQPGQPRPDRNANNVTNAVSVSGGKLVIRTYSYFDPNNPNPLLPPHYTGMIQTGASLLRLNPGDPTECQITDELVPARSAQNPGYLPRYGYIEARIDFDGSSGMWHSFFMVTDKGLRRGPMVEQDRGMEMDIVEHKKMMGSGEAGYPITDVSNVAEAASHWISQASPVCPDATDSWSAGSGPRLGNGSLGDGFHTYGLMWTPDFLKYYYDDNLVWTENNSTAQHLASDPHSPVPCVPGGDPHVCALAPVPHTNEFFILCGEVPLPTQSNIRSYGSVPVPGGFGSLGSSSNPKMTVDYVRVYQDPPPAAVTNLLPHIGKKSVTLSWTAPGDDGTGETVVQYDLRRSTSNIITDADFAAATQITTSAPHVSGYPECKMVNNLVCGTTYYFAIKSSDELGNWSAISNVPTANTPCTGAGVSCGPPPTDTTAPAAVTNLSVTCIGNTMLTLGWTAPGDDGTTGRAAEYDLRYSTSTITASNFGSATRFPVSVPSAAGSVDNGVVAGLSTCHVYFFALKTRDDVGNWSGISNVTSGSTVCENQLPTCDEGGGAAKRPIIASDEASRLFTPGANPARGTTSFRISVPRESQGATLRVGVFDVQGRRVRSLVNRIATPGSLPIDWNLLDDSGRRVASGLYMVRVDVGDVRKTFRLTVVR